MSVARPLDMFNDECEDNQNQPHQDEDDNASDRGYDQINDVSDDEKDPDDLNRVIDPEMIQRQQNDILYSI